MKSGLRTTFICAAFSLVWLAGYHATRQTFAQPYQPPTKAKQCRPMIFTKGILAIGSYELNAAFTPDGEVICFSISTAPAADHPKV